MSVRHVIMRCVRVRVVRVMWVVWVVWVVRMVRMVPMWGVGMLSTFTIATCPKASTIATTPAPTGRIIACYAVRTPPTRARVARAIWGW